jgi:hypothetical protein
MADIGTLTPEQMLEQQKILRQQKMAEMLLQQGMEQPKGQMISGRYVAPSWTQNLAGLANTYVGQRNLEKADQAQIDMAKAIREQQKVGMADYYQTLKGTPSQAGNLQLGNTNQAIGSVEEPIGQYKAPVAGQAPNPALANLTASMDERLPAFLREHAMKEITKGPKWEKDVRYDDKGREIHGWTDVNDPSLPFAAQTKKPEMTASERIHANIALGRAADEGIPVGGGVGYGNPVVSPVTPVGRQMPVNNAPVGASPVVKQNAPQVSIAPNAPSYAQGSVTMQPTNNTLNANQLPVAPQISMAGVSPKKQREIAGAQAEALQTNVKNAYDAYPILKDIEKLLPQSSSGYIQRGWTGLTRAASISTDMSKADTALDVLAPKLTMFQPRFEGPQGKDDVKIYQAMAGRLSDSSLPYEDRLAALEQLKDIYKRYAPNLDWSFAPTPVANPQSPKPAAQSNAPSAPAGVDPAVWAVMTPAERSLWQPNKR